MKRNALILVIAGLSVAAAAWQIAANGGSGNTAGAAATAAIPVTAPSPTPSAPGASGGYVLHVDEQGRFVEEGVPQAAQDLSAALARSVNTSSEGLIEVASPVAGGGVMVDLQGRFQTTATATVNANGGLHVPCLAHETDARLFTEAAAANNAAGKE